MITFIITNKDRPKCSIQLLISFMGEKYKKGTGCSVPLKYWNDSKKRVKINSSNVEMSDINDILDRWEEAGNKTMEFFKAERKLAPTKDEFFEKLNEFRFGVYTKERTLLLDYLDTYIERYTPLRTPNRVKSYKLTRTIIERYQTDKKKKLYFEDLNVSFYIRFTEWFYSFGYSANYLGMIVVVLRLVIKEARDVDKLHNSDEFFNKAIIAPKAEVDNIYLTEEELIRIHNLKITKELIAENFEDINERDISRKVTAYSKAKNMFLIGAFTGLRFSDFSKLKSDNITDSIRIQTQKTKTRVVIPVHWVVREIIDSGYDFSMMWEQKLNMHIKQIARMAGFTEDIVIKRNVAGEDIEIKKKKYELICTHTARRSFATNAYKAGIPTISIMMITGHKSESSFMKYIKISKEENAEILQSHSFFLDKK